MRIYVFRHGIAEERDARRWPNDDRPLTEEGIRKTREAARAFPPLEVEPARILTSPLRRARETAEIARDAVPARPALEVEESLLPDASPAAVASTLERAPRGGGDWMVVGHEPHLSSLVAHLLAPGARIEIAMKKAGLACLEWDGPPAPGRGRLVFLLEPRHLRAIGRGSKE